MIVTIENGLEHIEEYLRATGKYDVKLENEYKGITDALIYKREKDSDYFKGFQEELRVNNLAVQDHAEHGLIIINAKNRTPKEVEKILESRLVQNIF